MQNQEYSTLTPLRSVETAQKALRVLFLEPQPCIRALKYAIALKHYLKNKVSLCFGHIGHPLSKLYGFGEEYFDHVIRLDPEKIYESVREIIDEYKPQIIHSHNAPDTLTLTAIDVAEGTPVIHDVHEVISLHSSGFFEGDDEEKVARYCKEEKKACEKSHGLVYATEGIKRYIQQRYDVDGQENIVFYNYACKSAMPRSFKERLSARDKEVHIVYIGCITSVVEGSHYDLREIFRRVADNKFHMHIYPTNDRITKSNETYRKIAESNRFIHCHDHMDYRELLYEITQYDFGWAGFNGVENGKHLDIALQNKIFDYISSGLPVIAFPHRAIQRFLDKHGIGLVIKDVNELPELLRSTNICELTRRTIRSRVKLTFESNIPKLVGFYNRILEITGD